MESIIGKLTEKDGTYLTINSLQGERAFGTSKSIQARDCPGYILRGDKITEWKVTSIRELGGKIAFVGPNFEGRPLIDVAGESDPLPALVRFIRASARLAESVSERFCVNPAFVLLADDGTLFFLPYAIARIIAAQVPESEAAATFGPYEAPDLFGEAALSFTIGSLCYRAIASKCAFAGSTRYGIETDMRDGNFLPLALAEPDVAKKVSSITDRALSSARVTGLRSDRPVTMKRQARAPIAVPHAPSLDEWSEVAFELEGGRIRTALSPQEASRKAAEKKKYLARKTRRVSTARFFRKYQTIMIGVAVALAIAGIVVGTIIQGKQDANHTVGLTPTEVVRTYYRGLNELNQSLMEECVIGKAGSEDLNLVINYYVVSRVRIGYERFDYFVPAQKWVDAGKPAYDKPYDVLGVTGLNFLEGSMTPTEADLLVEYVLWIPNRTESNPNAPPKETLKEKRIHLTRDTEKNRWYIDSIADVK